MKHLLCFFLLVTFSFPAVAARPQTAAKQAILIDYETGTVLYAKNADQRMPTSSMSKVISMYAVFEALESGQIALTDTFRVSEKAWRKGGSKMFVEVNKDVKIEDLIRGVIIQSGNDATIVLAEGLSGGEEAFAIRLNEIAGKLGMKDSNFVNASGWPDDNHYSTAKDLAKLGRALIVNFPEYYGYYAEKEFTYNDIKQPNRNPLLYQNIGADGIKTGHTDAGGFGRIGSGVAPDGRRVIMVVNGLDSTKARAQESKKLLSWGLANFKKETVFTAGEAVKSVPVVLGKQAHVEAVLKEDIAMILPRNADDEIKVEVQFNTPISAPVATGTKVGTLTITPPDMQPVSAALYAASDVEKLGFFKRAIANGKQLVIGR